MVPPLPILPPPGGLPVRLGAGRLDRRRLLQLSAAGLGALALAACTGPGGRPSPEGVDAGTIVWANRPGELAADDPTLATFTRHTGIRLRYQAEVDDDAAFLARLQAALGAEQASGVDLVCLADWAALELRDAQRSLPLDRSAIPNLVQLLPALGEAGGAPGGTHAVPWQCGYTGLVYNAALVPGGIRAVEELWRPEFAGRVVVDGGIRDVLGLLLLSRGVDIAGEGWGDDEVDAALEVVRAQRGIGRLGAPAGRSALEALASGEAVVGIVRSSDISAGIRRDPAAPPLEFVLPDSGGVLWHDDFLVPGDCEQPGLAQQLINYCYDPEAAARLAASTRRLSPVTGIESALASIEPRLAEDPLIVADPADLARTRSCRRLEDAQARRYAAAWRAAWELGTGTVS